jgi:hypothetical protein
MLVGATKVTDMKLYVYVTCWVSPRIKRNELKLKYEYLANLVLGISRINCSGINFVLVSNVYPEEFDFLLKPLEFNSNNLARVEVVTREQMIDGPTGKFVPWLLTWSHKSIMRRDVKTGDKNSFYLYLEDDALFTQENLEYFMEYRLVLAEKGLIPGFLRGEWSGIHSKWIHPDTFNSGSIQNQFRIKDRWELYLQRENPYSASILLDHELALEYIDSESFDQQEAWKKHKYIYDIGSTAALGLIAESIPNGYLNRVTTPHNPVNLFPHPSSILRHQSNKYANDVWQSHFELFESRFSERIKPKRNIYRYAARLASRDVIPILKEKWLSLLQK